MFFQLIRGQDIKDFADRLNIELIYVPANGTGTYQPLDRKIFGIVKKKLVEREMHSSFQCHGSRQSELYGQAHEMVIKNWNNISCSANISAWDIPGLYIQRDDLYDDEEE